MVKRIKFLNF